MASLFQEDLHSSDSEDDDYVPEGEVSSDDDEEPIPPDDEIEIKKKGKSKKNLKELGTEDEKSKTLDGSSSKETSVDEKQRANDLFKSFLEEVEADMKVSEPSLKNPEKDSAFDETEVPSSDLSVKSNENKPKQESCELFEFAGETVAVSPENGTKIVSTEKNTNSAVENLSGKPTNQPPLTKRRGIDAVLGTIMNKKAKLTTLQKTSLDWNKYKSEEGISEELENYNKGRGGFIERQRFLERSDIRSYEIERDLRMAKRKKN